MPDDESRERPPGGVRPFWSGTIAFGLVSIPVSLIVANRSAGVALRMVDADGTPLRRRYQCSRDEEFLEAEDIVRGYEVEPDRYVTIDDEELEALAPEKSREIDLKRFVPLEGIDPIFFDRAYFLVPDRGAVKAYRLLARTMQDGGRAGIATFVMRGKEYLVAIIGERGLLRAETLRFHDELRSAEDVGLPEVDSPQARRVREMAGAIRGLSADTLDRELLEDGYRHRLQALIQRKLEAGEGVVSAPEADEEDEAPHSAEVVDLMQVLKRSLKGGPPPKAGKKAATGKKAARKPAGKGSGRKAGKPEAGALDTRSKSELYERAQALGIEGRSQMTKQELIEAIRAAR